jgi:hypothetical protein
VTRQDVKRLVAYMAAVWPGYPGWERYGAAQTVDVWVDRLSAADVTREECIAAVDGMIGRGDAVPPSLPQLVSLARPIGQSRREEPMRLALAGEYRAEAAQLRARIEKGQGAERLPEQQSRLRWLDEMIDLYERVER